MFRAKQMIQDKTQTANNGSSLLRAVTPYWIICLAPFGRAGKRSFAVLRLWARTSHCRRDVPCAQPLPDSLNTAISPRRSTNEAWEKLRGVSEEDAQSRYIELIRKLGGEF